MTDIDSIRKKHVLDMEGLSPHILTWKLSSLTISDVDALLKALDDARGKEKAAIHFARMFEKERDDARGKVDMLIDFIPEGWEMPLGWTQLVKQVKGGGE